MGRWGSRPAFYHASNGGLGENNPGTDVLEVVLGFPVGTTSN